MYQFKKLDPNQIHDYEPILDHMVEIWEKRGGGPELKQIMMDKIASIKEDKVDGVLQANDSKVCGISWWEKTTPHYGNINYHTYHDDDADALVTHTIEQGIFDQAIMEIVQVWESDIYRKTLENAKLTVNIRQRMSLWIDQGLYFPDEETDIEYYRMTRDDIPVTGPMSYEAHLISQDYWMYPELSNANKRIGLEEKVFDQLYGPVIEEASIKAMLNGQCVGYCLMIEVPCWGYDKVPWVFDIIVDPKYHGRGIGTHMLKKVINILTSMDYPIMGLAATKDNYAVKLYEKLEFQEVDTFYEYIKL